MYVVTHVEQLEPLEGLGEGCDIGSRTGKEGNRIIHLFEHESSAVAWCETVATKKRWADANELEKGVRIFWYEIWDFPVIKDLKYGCPDENFIAAYTRFGQRIDCGWTPDWSMVQETEQEHIKTMEKRICEEATISIEMSPNELIETITDIAENAMVRVLKQTNLWTSPEDMSPEITNHPENEATIRTQMPKNTGKKKAKKKSGSKRN